ncbi:MAG: sialate O-acetylesterase [Pseudomonadota bacterium]
MTFYAKSSGNKAYANIDGMINGYTYNTDIGFHISDGKTIPATWTKYQYDLVLPADHNRINFSAQCDGGTGYFCLSDISIKRIISTDPSYQPTPTPSPVPVVTAAPGVDRSKNYVYILIGQSNMAGINTSDPQDSLCDPRIFKMSQTNFDQWLLGTENMNSNSTGGGTSPGKSIAEQLLQQVPTDVNIRMIGAAASGSAVEQWAKGSTNNQYNKAAGNLYNDLVLRIHAAQKIGVIKGIFWHQGEANSGTTDYEQKLTALITDLRLEIGTPDLPYVMGQIGTTGDATGGVNRSLDLIKYFVPNTNFASCAGMVLADNVHYNASSQRLYGTRYAASYLALNPVLIPEATPTPTLSPTPTPSPTPGPHFYIRAEKDAQEIGAVPGKFYAYCVLDPGFYADGFATIPYAISGTAVNGVDYELISGVVNVVVGYGIGPLPQNTHPLSYIQIVPIPNNLADGDKTVILGSNATVIIHDGGVMSTPTPTVAPVTPTPTIAPATPTPTPTPTATPTQSPIPVTGLSIGKTSATIKVPLTLQLTAVVSPANAANKAVKWTSSNTKVATVSSTGKVTAKGPGTATITVKTVSGAFAKTCKVKVLMPVKSVKLNKTSISLAKGKTSQLKATVSPTNASNKKVTWKSSNTKIVTVSSTGLVKTKAKGTAYVTVITSDGKKTARCKVSVK